jgi:hypothetical protein
MIEKEKKGSTGDKSLYLNKHTLHQKKEEVMMLSTT